MVQNQTAVLYATLCFRLFVCLFFVLFCFLSCWHKAHYSRYFHLLRWIKNRHFRWGEDHNHNQANCHHRQNGFMGNLVTKRTGFPNNWLICMKEEGWKQCMTSVHRIFSFLCNSAISNPRTHKGAMIHMGGCDTAQSPFVA